jgi:hypothetical protein
MLLNKRIDDRLGKNNLRKQNTEKVENRFRTEVEVGKSTALRELKIK